MGDDNKTFSVRMQSELKEQFDRTCKDMGMTMSTAINIFATTVVREHKIPFEISTGTDESKTTENRK